MANSKILINFSEVPLVNAVISFTETNSGIIFMETFKAIRSIAKETEIPDYDPDSSTYPDYISTNYEFALNQDYNLPTALFTITKTLGPLGSGIGSVTIESNYPSAVFVLNTNTTGAIITITNVEEEIPPVENVVSPESINFYVNKSSDIVGSKTLEIQTEVGWIVTNDLPLWLEMSELFGTGSSTLNLTPVNYSELEPGTYEFTLNIEIGDDYFDVFIKLIVSEILENPFNNENIYFTKEDVYLKFNSEKVNSYIHFSVDIKIFEINTNTPITYEREYNLALFKGKGEFHVGDIVEGLLNEINALKDFVPDYKSNYVKKQNRPTEVEVTFQEKDYLTNDILTEGIIDAIKMLKGYRPFITAGQLALLTVSQQEITRITPDSVIGTSFVYIGTPRIIVKLNNTVLEDFEVDETANEIVYSYYRFINSLKPGDSIEIIIVNDLETRTQRFLVFKRGLENTYLFFENKNGMIEPYEFSGRRRVNSAIKHTTTTKLKNRVKYEKKVFTENQQGLIINTGQLLKTDQRIITAIIESKNVWCSFDNPEGPYFQIDATTTKLTNQDTDTSEESFDIEFNILEDTDASIFPR
jgi:hypothetical protein